MLSKPAFNGLLKTLEEPPPHVKFIFATTEIRKVPVTVLSRCQRFDLRRIDSAELAGYLGAIAAKEKVEIEEGALALIARAAEGSARDALSLLDQAIAHGEGAIRADTIRDMLGLADRGRVLDLFEKLMGGQITEALADLKGLYDSGADPLAVIQDLLETTHFLTRVKVAPTAQGFFDGGSGEAKRAAALAAKLSVASLTRAWQMLLKGLFEVRDATRPILACEMALIRLAYASELPPTDRLVRDILDNGRDAKGDARQGVTPPGAPASRAQGNPSASLSSSAAPQAKRNPVAEPGNAAPVMRGLEDIAALAAANHAPVLKVHIENDVHLVRLEQMAELGRLEFRPGARAPRTLAGDLQQKLRDWTGLRWSVSVSNDAGAPTLAEQKKNAKAARIESVAQTSLVRAVLDRFPGAEIVAVRDVQAPEAAPAMPEKED
jgi:DNA polymerase-3 subunit gamma/tau